MNDTTRLRHRRWCRVAKPAVASLMVLGLAACSTPPTPAPQATSNAETVPPSTPAQASPSASAAVIGGIPDLGLTKVQTDRSTAQAADLTPDGGTLTATGADGTVYTLTIPADALQVPTRVAMYPVTALAGDAMFVAGVQLAPEGLTLEVPAKLTIALNPAATQKTLEGIAWRGDAAGLHVRPIERDGPAVAMQVFHFSGDAVDEVPIAPLLPTDCRSEDDMDALFAADLSNDPASARPQISTDLKRCFLNVVGPALDAGTAAATASGEAELGARDEAVVAYGIWLYGLQLARTTLKDPTFTVTPELTRSQAKAVAFLRAWYGFWNRACAEDAAADWHLSIKDARIGLGDTSALAATWSLATRAHRLDRQTLLDQLCAQVVINPNRRYSAVLPGESGTVTVHAGLSINHGPLHTDAGLIRVRVKLSSSDVAAGEGPIAADGSFSANLEWPAGVDPIKVDILATLIDVEGVLDSPGVTIEVPTDIERFDRITKHAEQLSFTFTHGFDSWSGGTIGPEGGMPWGLVDHLPDGGGVMHLDGRGSGSGAKAWIDRGFDLPTSTTALTFDVSAEVIAGSSSSVRVRIVANGVSTTILSTTVHNATNQLSFTRKRIDLSRWAGKHVTIFIEQNYNGTDGFDKEIYVDNVRILTS
jgi:hypothetical protein